MHVCTFHLNKLPDPPLLSPDLLAFPLKVFDKVNLLTDNLLIIDNRQDQAGKGLAPALNHQYFSKL